MASKKKRKGMVFHQEGATSPVAAPAADHPSSRFVVPTLGKASEGGMEQSNCATNEEADMMGKPNMYPYKEPVRNAGGLAAVKLPYSSNPEPDNLSPDSICKGIKVTLDNNGMWNEFFKCKTEMIVTKQGSRMFPYCRFRISGLQPSRKYSLIMDIQLLDISRYKWNGKSWQVAGKAESHGKSQPFAHPESPSTGEHWMKNPVSFYKLKLTNNVSEQEENTILHPMHRYLPRLHLIQTDKASEDINLKGRNLMTFTFPQTEFMAVTAYQNPQLSQLKVDYNPFAKGLKEESSSPFGLKLKLNPDKDVHKGGGTTTNEQHPLKKSLKSLLANHKPKSLKAVDAKPSGSSDLQKKSTTNEDQSAASVTGECSGNSRPAQKLFSELIREAHVSLHRCNVEQLAITNGTSPRTEQPQTKTPALKSNEQDVPRRDSRSVKTNSFDRSETVQTKRKVKENKDLLNSTHCKDNVRTDSSELHNDSPAVSQNSSVESDHQHQLKALSEGKEKQHKRPAPLPLPALARFLKQHSTKSKKAKSKLDSPPQAIPSERSSNSKSSAAAPTCPQSDPFVKATDPSKDPTGDITKYNNRASGHTSEHHLDEMDLNVTGQAGKTANERSSPSCPGDNATTGPSGLSTEDFLASVSVSECNSHVGQDGTPVLPNFYQPFCTLGTSLSTISSALATSSESPIWSPSHDTVLPAPNFPQTQTIHDSSTLPSDSPTSKSDSLLPDPECSSFAFEELSPASSPEPLPSLPLSLALEFDCSTSEPPPQAVSPEELQHSEASVFKWHTVLPLPKPYIETSLATFQPTPETLPSVSVASPFLPSQTPSQSEPQVIDTSTSMAPLDPGPSFQENVQLLPFPAQLSPLALQLPLSPTFSSLDGDELSPTASIAELVYFFSNDHDLGMEFSNTEAIDVPCSPPSKVESNAHEPSPQVQPIPAKRTCKQKKKPRQRKLVDVDQDIDPSYGRMHPNLEEVEEQLFISFTSKEALKLHLADSSDGPESQPQTTPEGPVLQETTDTPENVETTDEIERIAAFEKILLRDLKLLRHRQVIHPVLQEVGLKMSQLDTTLAVDLQYLGVHLPIPPPGVSLEPLTQELPPPPGISAAFVSRTGKTTDVTQIKGWREKYTPLEAPPTPTPTTPEAGPSSDPPKKNLSAFCSDMLDEYLENEAKLIDERADSFSQSAVEPLVYELPTRSTSYVRTLDSVLKKQTSFSPTSDLISGFIPPSKRPKLTLKEAKKPRKEKLKRGPKPKNREEPLPGSTPSLSPTQSNLLPKQPGLHIPAAPTPSEHTAPLPVPLKPRKQHLKVRFNEPEPAPLPHQPKLRKLKPKPSSQTLSLHTAPPPGVFEDVAPPPGVFEDMAPLESDSELVDPESHRTEGGPVMTRALLRQKDLEDAMLWEGLPRTSITKERAAIALTSLFTLKGFVIENPTAPIQLVRRPAPPCLNESCRLGCICSSLANCSRISHCGRPACMLGCSCLKQKVVLLKNLDGSDSSPSQPGHKKKRRKRRMKMAYVLKEADSVSQPAQRVRTLWKRDAADPDPDPMRTPGPPPLSHPTERLEDSSSCARIRAFVGKNRRSTRTPKTPGSPQESKDAESTKVEPKSLKGKVSTSKKTKAKSSIPPSGDPQPAPSPPAKPSKRLIIVAECQWVKEGDRNMVLRTLCEAMARDNLEKPFWIKDYLVSPVSTSLEESEGERCIQFKMHISRPKLTKEEPAKRRRPRRPKPPIKEKTQPQQDPPEEMQMEMKPPEDWQREVEEEEEVVMEEVEEEEEVVMQEVEEEEEVVMQEVEEEVEEAKPLEDWQREVEEDDMEEEQEAGSTNHQVHDGKQIRRQEVMSREKSKMMGSLGLPFLAGVSPAGFLSAYTKQPGNTDHTVHVNGKPYPLAKIQLGKMGALHPANRLAAYLTGRVGNIRKQQPPSQPPQSSAPTPPEVYSKPPRSSAPTPPEVSSQPPPRSSAPTPPEVSSQPPPRSSAPTPPKVSSQPPPRIAPGPALATLKVYYQPPQSSAPTPPNPPSQPPQSSAPTPPKVSSQPPQSSAPTPPNPPSQPPQSSAPTPPKVSTQPPQSSAPNPPQPPSQPPQSSAPTPPKVSSSSYMVPTPATPYRQTVTMRFHESAHSVTGGKVDQSAASSDWPAGSAPKGSQLMLQEQRMFQIFPPAKLPQPSPAPCPPPLSPSSSSSSTPSSTQRLVLQSVKMASGQQFFRKPDGKLVQLVPLSQLRANKNLFVQQIFPPPSHPNTVILAKQPPPQTSVPSSSSSSSSSSLISSHNTSTTLLSQTGKHTFKIVRPRSSGEPVVVTSTKVTPKVETSAGSQPPPTTQVNCISLKPGQAVDFGVKTMTVSSSGVHQKPTSSGTRAPPPEVLTVPPPELASKRMDLDIICVDDDGMGPPWSETEGAGEQSLDVMKEEEESSSETNSSSDFGEYTDSDEETKPDLQQSRHLHNAREKQRRKGLQTKFNALSRECGLKEDKSSKVSTLNTASNLIKQLMLTETNLEERKRMLTKQRDNFIKFIAPTTEEIDQMSRKYHRSPESTESDVEEELLEVDEVTENSSNDEILVTKNNNVEEGVQSFAMETLVKRRRTRNKRNSKSSLRQMKPVDFHSNSPAFKDLSSMVKSKDSPKTFMLREAQQEILNLQNETARLKSLKICLNQKRENFIKKIRERTGTTQQRVQGSLQQLTSKHTTIEEKKGRPTANQLSAERGGGAVDPPASSDDDIIITSSFPQKDPPLSAPIRQQLQRVVQMLPPIMPPPAVSHNASGESDRRKMVPNILSPPAVSHNAPVERDRPKTVPNILSRTKKPAVLPCYQAMFPLVGSALPGQQFLTFNPTVLQTSPSPGVTSIINIPGQVIHLPSLPHPSTARDLNNLLHLVPPSTAEHQQILQQIQEQQQQQILLQQMLQQQQQQEPHEKTQTPPPPQKVAEIPPDPRSSPPPPSNQGPSSSPCPGKSADPGAEVLGMKGSLEQQQKDEETKDDEGLMSLLNEIDFLNQRTVTTASTTTSVLLPGLSSGGGAKEEKGAALSPWALELDSDSEESTTTENAKGGGGVLAPPPLQQMKVGGAEKVMEPANSDGEEEEEGGGGEEEEEEEEGGGGGGGEEKKDGGQMAWRPMPRLVPLGLRGNPPS
ncbi:MAX gene-associated protein isoform X2 [Pseudochaenichthys georgianus]|uniref:MAX gene-associated protein isoform X2 n=1 Tax=Pseudochaenichthys georgianus TaxID=52239 RepID=UPI00146F5838|nr:MAX dimerization protein MGA a isoform X2 [Pseudochaenichthys georgianus]